jgi:plastocyanin
MRKLAVVAAVAALAATAIAVTPVSAGSTKKVAVGNDFFSKKKLSVKKGTKVVWRWTEGGVPHNVTPANGKRGSKTSSRKGFKFAKTFRRKGTFRYICTVHPDSMRMSVRVR